MAERSHHRRPEAPEEEQPESEAAPVIETVGHVTVPPTLMEAFTVLCAALQGHLDDNLVVAQHCDEIQAWMANSGGDGRSSNSILAWRHAIQILSEVLGQPMTGG